MFLFAGPPAKPQLGTTYDKRTDAATPDSPEADPQWNTWGPGSASDFRVRTKGARLFEGDQRVLFALV